MKYIVLSLIVLITVHIGFSQNAVTYCEVTYSASSISTGVYCEYCDEEVSINIPYKIEFQKPLVCDTYDDPQNATETGKCKFNTIMHSLSFMCFDLWYTSNDFASRECLSEDNPNYKHKVIEKEGIDMGQIEYSFKEWEMNSLKKNIEEIGYTMDPESYKEGRAIATKYSIQVMSSSCP